VTSDDAERRRRYFDEVKDVADRHLVSGAEYEKHAIDLALNVFRTLTYLNGGALVAIPTAVAMFQADARQVKVALLAAAAAFVAGLLSVVLAQAMAFFTMARRSEAENLRHYSSSSRSE
jgi:sulfite exporter TauE/SafE